MLELAAAQSKELTAQQASHKPFEQMSFADLKAYFAEPPGYVSPRQSRGWEVVRRFTRELLSEPQDAARIEKELTEVLRAIENNQRRPAPASVHFLAPPILFWDHLHNPIARGELPAANVITNAEERDPSRLDPEPSTFWQRPRSIASQDLFAGFGRQVLPSYETNLWEYTGPKTSWGTAPGFEARCGNVEIKVKLAETRSEPFTARIFYALGFHADPTDHAPYLKIKYNLRLFREFHLRKDLTVGIQAFGFQFYSINFQKRYDPFSFIAEAVLKDGTRLSGKELKKFLLHNPTGRFPEDDPSNFRTEREAEVDYLVTTPANVQLSHTPFKSIGPWSFEGLRHEHLRELRGAALLAAWVGWCDSRFENTRLKVCEADGQLRLAHFFSDLGAGLGKSAGLISRRMESPELFPWTFTSPRKFQGKGKMTIPFRIRNFRPVDDTAAFEQMTMDDARWMARLIAQLTEQQIEQALIASGFNPTHVRIYTDKLINRRDRMIYDLELSAEILPLRPQAAQSHHRR